MAAEQTENKVGREIMRLLKICREASVENLLDEALAGRTKDTDTVCRLYRFVRDSFGPETLYPNRPELNSETTKKYLKACSAYLEDAGVDEKEIQKLREYGNSSGCVLSEFE
jgi:hypothetical protein